MRFDFACFTMFWERDVPHYRPAQGVDVTLVAGALVLTPSGDLPEVLPDLALGGSDALTVRAYVELIRKAKGDARIKGILLKPVTSVTIQRLRGILKRKPGDKPFAQEWAEHKREEIELEEAKYARCTGSR